MSWLFLGLISVLFLGLYDLCKKFSVQNNAVLPVLFYSTLFGSIPTLPVIGLNVLNPNLAHAWQLSLIHLNLSQWLGIAVKASIVSASWFCSYLAIKHLPLSIASPIRASQPIWTLVGAVLLFHEIPSSLQTLGLVIVLVSYFLLAFKNSQSSAFHWKWGLLMLLAAWFAAWSGFLDKYLLQNQGIPPLTLQCYFNLFLILILGSTFAFNRWTSPSQTRTFEWRWSIALIGLLLFAADMAYFSALHQEGAMLSVLSPLRRGNAVISFIAGIFILKEALHLRKIIAVSGIALGIVLLITGSPS